MTVEGYGPRDFRRSEGVSRETLDKLSVFADLLARWNRTARLVAPSTLGSIWHRHMLDSAQLLDHLPTKADKVVDIGTGGGFPGLVLSIIAAERQPCTRFVLVDGNARKCEFLREVCRRTGNGAEIRDVRDSELEPQCADVVTARAVAPLGRLLGMACRHLSEGGTCVFLKGKGVATEIESAAGSWRFEVTATPSRTDGSGRILLIRELTHG